MEKLKPASIENHYYLTGGSFFNCVDTWDNLTKSIDEKVDRVIDSRISYLNKIQCIGDNWISGGSSAPNEKSVEIGKSILCTYKSALQSHRRDEMCKAILHPNPAIILSPIPSGGIYIEFRMNEENNTAIIIHNNEEIEFEFQVEGEFFEKSGVTSENVFSALNTFMNANGVCKYTKRSHTI
jgi:hypothetical protein